MVIMPLTTHTTAIVKEDCHSARMGKKIARIWNGAKLFVLPAIYSIHISFATNFKGGEEWLERLIINFLGFYLAEGLK